MEIGEKLKTGLLILWQAHLYAQDSGTDPWDFSLRTTYLFEAGVTVSDLRWLAAKGYVEHAQETSVYGDPHRSFRRGSGFFLDSATCLILTASGAAQAEKTWKESGAKSLSQALKALNASETNSNEHSSAGNGKIHAGLKPTWNAARRVLSLGNRIVKRFRVPARNQETILCAYEEEGWPEYIDDPLPFHVEIDPHTRLHDTVNRLNGKHLNQLVRFHLNGNGKGVYWELLE